MNGSRFSFGRTLGRTLINFIPWELAHTCIWQMIHIAGEPGATRSVWVDSGMGIDWNVYRFSFNQFQKSGAV